MDKPSFVVTVSVNGVSDSSVWDSGKPLKIGHPFRWVLEKTDKGVRVRNLASERPAAVRELEDGAIANGLSCELPEPEAKSAFSLSIRPVESLPPVIQTHGPERGEWRIYAFRGDWTLESESLDRRYDGTIEGRDAFRIRRKSEDEFVLRSLVDGLCFGGGRLGRGEQVVLRSADIAGCTLRWGEFQWKVRSLKRVRTPEETARTRLFAGDEGRLFKKALQGAAAAIAILALLAFLWPKPETVTMITPQFAKLIYKKPVRAFMTAAASGYASDPSHGKESPSHPRGSSIAKARKNGHPRVAVRRAVENVARVAGHRTSRHQSSAVAGRRERPMRQRHRMAQAKPARPHSYAPSRHFNAPSRGARVIAPADAHQERNTEMARALSARGFRNAERGLVRGGMSGMLSDTGFASGRDAKAEARGLFNGRSGSHGGAFAPSDRLSDSLGSRRVEVASLGGDAGLFGGNGGVGYGRGSHARISGQGRSFVSLDTGASDVDDGLTKEQVGEVIHRHMSEIRYCYEASQLRVPDLQGRLSVAFVVGGQGGVNTARVSRSSLGVDRSASASGGRLGECLLSRLRTWKFPEPRGHVNVAVSYPFIFKTLGR